MTKIQPQEIIFNPIKKISEDWCLITAGDKNKYNTMTASWAQMGFMWRKPVITVYVRPSRYTYEFIENTDYFTVSFFGSEYKQALSILGKKSGRDTDKIKEAGLNPKFIDDTVSFDESEYIFICKKLYSDDIKLENFLDDDAKNVYTDNNLHRQYVAEIISVYKK